MSKKKAGDEVGVVETFPVAEAVAETSEVETKATVGGVFVVDGRLAVCDSESEAIRIFEACFNTKPIEVVESGRLPRVGEKVLHVRGSVPMYGLPE